jgi:hypothetical protein
MLLALAMALALAPPPSSKATPKQKTAKPLGVIIWAGGSTKAAGDAALADAKKNVPKDIALAPGFPKLVESKDVPGLKPGFHVALLGVCKASKGNAVVSRLRESKDGVYQRRVAAHPSLVIACPTMPRRAPDSGPKLMLGKVEATIVSTIEDSCADAPEPTAEEEPRSCTYEETVDIVAVIDGVRRVLVDDQLIQRSSSDVECDSGEQYSGPDLVDAAPGEKLPRLSFTYAKIDGCAGVYAPGPTQEEIEAAVKENSVLLKFDGTTYVDAN